MLDPNFVIIRPQTDNIEERYYINELPIIATATKSIQEQQEMIEQLQEKDKQKDKEIDKTVYTTEVTASRLEFADGKDASGNTPIPFPEADADGFQHIPDGYGEELPFR